LLAEMNRTWGTTVVIATHSGIADHLATMQLYLEDGKTVQWP
jgi:ABC-type lipoprotein export system ATPase subunit